MGGERREKEGGVGGEGKRGNGGGLVEREGAEIKKERERDWRGGER